MTISLPDVNVWIALAAEAHPHHAPAREWFRAQATASIAFCRVTHMGLLRLLTNPSVMGGTPRTIPQAWEIAGELRRDRRVVFGREPEGVELFWHRLMTQSRVGPQFWTDAYLAAFAFACSYQLVTFDKGFGRWTELHLALLRVPSGD